MIFWKFLIEIAAKIVVRRVPIFLVSSLRILGLRVDIRSKDKLKLILRNEWTRFARSRYPIIKDAYRIIRIRCKNPLLPSTVQSYYKLKPRLDAGIAWGIIGNRESLENVKTIPRLLPNYPRIRIHTNLTCFAVSRSGSPAFEVDLTTSRPICHLLLYINTRRILKSFEPSECNPDGD